jgi:plasmid stability protein
MNSLTLRQIPDNLEKKLRAVSRKTGKSLNKTAIDCLNQALGITEKKSALKKFRNVSNIFKNWDKENINQLNKDLKIFEKIDEEIWKQ